MVPCGRFERDHEHNQISDVARHVIPEERIVRDFEKPAHGSAFRVTGSFTRASIGRLPVSNTSCKESLLLELSCRLARISSSSFPRRFAFSSAVKYACRP